MTWDTRINALGDPCTVPRRRIPGCFLCNIVQETVADIVRLLCYTPPTYHRVGQIERCPRLYMRSPSPNMTNYESDKHATDFTALTLFLCHYCSLYLPPASVSVSPPPPSSPGPVPLVDRPGVCTQKTAFKE